MSYIVVPIHNDGHSAMLRVILHCEGVNGEVTIYG